MAKTFGCNPIEFNEPKTETVVHPPLGNLRDRAFRIEKMVNLMGWVRDDIADIALEELHSDSNRKDYDIAYAVASAVAFKAVADNMSKPSFSHSPFDMVVGG